MNIASAEPEFDLSLQYVKILTVQETYENLKFLLNFGASETQHETHLVTVFIRLNCGDYKQILNSSRTLVHARCVDGRVRLVEASDCM